jgi:hypothetical protein
MSVTLGKCHQFILVEDRFDHPYVGKMGPPEIRVIDGDDIPGVQVVFKVIQNSFSRVVEGAYMHCNVMGPLGYSVAISVIEAGAEIPVVNDEGITCPKDLLCHLVN